MKKKINNLINLTLILLMGIGSPLNSNPPFPMYQAAQLGNCSAIRDYIQNGYDVNEQNQQGMTPLHVAVHYNQQEATVFLLQNGADCNFQDKFGKTPLHEAIAYNNLDIATILLKHNANPDIQDNGGYTPLHTAVLNGNFKAVRLLILHGTNIEIQNNIDQTPEDLITTENDSNGCIRSYFQTTVPATQKLLIAVQNNNFKKAHNAIHNGAELIVHERETFNTPMRYALIQNNYAMALLLLAHKPNDVDLLNIKNKNCTTPLDHIACDPEHLITFLKTAYNS